MGRISRVMTVAVEVANVLDGAVTLPTEITSSAGPYSPYGTAVLHSPTHTKLACSVHSRVLHSAFSPTLVSSVCSVEFSTAFQDAIVNMGSAGISHPTPHGS